MDHPGSTPLDIVVRFSTSTPDLILPIPHPETTTALSLKQLIRANASAPISTSRLRLIHAGKVVPDTEALSRSLHARIAPPPVSEKAKGKRPVDEVERARVYVHCSVGDELSTAELGEEAVGAEKGNEKLAECVEKGTREWMLGSDSALTSTAIPEEESTSTTPAPRGFDRLLSAGFSTAEVATLRSQFLAIQAHTHTPDTMPHGQELLLLEERWMESSNSSSGSTDITGGQGEDVGGLDDLLRGTFTGFFWPMGAMFWLLREDGVWSGRRQACTLAGFAVNMSFGLFRLLG